MMFRRYSGNGKSSPGVLMVVASRPVLGVSPGAGVSGVDVFGAGSLLGRGSTGGFGFSATGTVFSAGFGVLVTGAGASSGGGVGVASGARRCFGAGAGAATSSTAYTGGEGSGVRTTPPSVPIAAH